MSQVKRLYVEKKPAYAVKAKELLDELLEDEELLQLRVDDELYELLDGLLYEGSLLLVALSALSAMLRCDLIALLRNASVSARFWEAMLDDTPRQSARAACVP